MAWVIVERWQPDQKQKFNEVRACYETFATKEAAEAHKATLTPKFGGRLYTLPESRQSSGSKPRGVKLRKHIR
jgi:hypothetical protein